MPDFTSSQDRSHRYSDFAGNCRGFLYHGGTFTGLNDPIAGTVDVYPSGISGNNIVGEYFSGNADVGHGFLYNGSTYTTLDDLLGTNDTYPLGISGNSIVGLSDLSNGVHEFLYNGTTWTWTTLDDPLGNSAYGISGNKIVGTYIDSSSVMHGFVATVPELSTVALLLAGILTVCGRRPLKDGVNSYDVETFGKWTD